MIKWGLLASACQNWQEHQLGYGAWAFTLWGLWVLYDLAHRPIPVEVAPQVTTVTKLERRREEKPEKPISPRSEQEEKLAGRMREQGLTEEEITSALSNLGFKRPMRVRRK